MDEPLPPTMPAVRVRDQIAEAKARMGALTDDERDEYFRVVVDDPTRRQELDDIADARLAEQGE